MLQIAFYLSCGATACYLWGRRIKRKADSFSSITRVVDFKRLDDLLKEKASKLLVVVSGKVASAATPSNGKHEDGPLGAVFNAKVEMGCETKLEDDGSGWITKSQNFLFQVKRSPWYLEDSTGVVKVVGAEAADDFLDALTPHFDMSLSEIFDSIVEPQQDSQEDSTGVVKVVGAEAADDFLDALTPHFDMSLSEIFDSIVEPQQDSQTIFRASLDTGTSLTIIGEAARDEAGNLTIQNLNEQPFRIFSGEGSFDKMVANLKSNSEFYFFYSKIFGTIAFAIVVFKGVSFIRRVLRERAENADSDNEENP
ncbi:hypothetical protein DY000_02054928 [Brassica cretica]|uniref:RING-type E3 ubiquitin transferase n=1 Tax=Brassica cretica TaxID=69181 RepID=A0ABQ7A891_BRACR|nr:hypothetical protein DY000_02054928 [Brassica cretica]